MALIIRNRCRAWDLAATAAEKQGFKKQRDPDYTVGLLAGYAAPKFQVQHVVRGQWAPKEVSDVIYQTAKNDGPDIPIWFEVEPGASGLLVVDHYKRVVLGGRYMVFGKHVTGDKKMRIRALAETAQAGNVELVNTGWDIQAFLREAASLGTNDEVHDDQMDAASLAYNVLTLEGENFDQWMDYYRDKRGAKKLTNRNVLLMKPEEYIQYLMEFEADQRSKMEARKALLRGTE